MNRNHFIENMKYSDFKRVLRDYFYSTYKLSTREIEIIFEFFKYPNENTNKHICKRLFVVEKTVKFHLTNIFKKVKVNSRGHLFTILPIEAFEKFVGKTLEKDIKNDPVKMEKVKKEIGLPLGSHRIV